MILRLKQFGLTFLKMPMISLWDLTASIWAIDGGLIYWEVAVTSGFLWIGRPDLLKLSKRMFGLLTSMLVSVQNMTWIIYIHFYLGTYSVATGTSYEAEGGTLSGTSRILTNSGFSGGKAVGYLGSFISRNKQSTVELTPSLLGHGGSVTINNVQGIGANQWVALYYANGDSTWRNTTVR